MNGRDPLSLPSFRLNDDENCEESENSDDWIDQINRSGVQFEGPEYQIDARQDHQEQGGQCLDLKIDKNKFFI